MKIKSLLLLVGAPFLLAAVRERPGPSPGPVLRIDYKVLLQAPQMLDTPPTQVVLTAPVIPLHEKMDYVVSVKLPDSRSQSNTFSVFLYRRIAPPYANCQKQLCWEYISSFSDSAPIGSTQTRSLKQFSGDVLIASWQRHLSGLPFPDEINPVSYVQIGSYHELEFKSRTRVTIDEARKN